MSCGGLGKRGASAAGIWCAGRDLRIGLVIGTDGGFITRMLSVRVRPRRAVGSGKQWMSWIERDDLVRLIRMSSPNPASPGQSMHGAIRSPSEIHRRTRKAAAPAAVFRIPARCCAPSRRILPTNSSWRPAGAAEQGAGNGFVFRHETCAARSSDL